MDYYLQLLSVLTAGTTAVKTGQEDNIYADTIILQNLSHIVQIGLCSNAGGVWLVGTSLLLGISIR